MIKAELIREVAANAETTNKTTEAVLDAFSNLVLDVLNRNRDEKITLPGLGVFSVKHVPERSGIVQLGSNKGSEWHKDAHDEIQFKISKTIKQL